MAGSVKAIVSDVHGNIEALKAVVDDMREQGAEAIYCLGDVVGYGPDPGDCLDILMHSKVFVLGNHDDAMIVEPTDFTADAARGAKWTRDRLRVARVKGDDPQARFKFLENAVVTHEEGNVLYVHGSPRDPTREYLYPEEARDHGKMWDIFRRVKRLCFMGHTHFPGVFIEPSTFLSPLAVEGIFNIPPGKVLCNVGSVGQPRDGDWRACYVLFDGKRIEFRRVAYDIEATVAKMSRIPELQPFLKLYKRS